MGSHSVLKYEEDMDDLVKDLTAAALKDGASSVWYTDETDKIRKKIKSHSISMQNNHCCYCRQHFDTESHAIWQIEHVLSQIDFPKFIFEPRNVAVACEGCNLAKLNKKVSKGAAYRNYPKTGASFLIIHPHYDDYETHMFNFGYIYVPKTKKGSKTIEVCNLFRFAEKYIDWQNPVDLAMVSEALSKLSKYGLDPKKMAKLLLMASLLS